MPEPRVDIAPKHKASAFTCLHCGECAAQTWGKPCLTDEQGETHTPLEGWEMTCCATCRGVTLWREGKMVMPTPLLGPPPNPDMPEEIRRVYNQARSVAAVSPQAACALLRAIIGWLAVPANPEQRSSHITRRVARLKAEEAIPASVHKELRRLRVVGPGAGVPGAFIKGDDATTAEQLLEVTALFADWILTTQKPTTGISGEEGAAQSSESR